MSKRKESQREEHLNLIEEYGKDFVVLSKEIPIDILLKIGRVVCYTDCAIQFYSNPKHPQFYKQDELVRKALRRTWSIGAFEHRETIIRMVLDMYDY